jgi:AcrR family transcriptional regulator
VVPTETRRSSAEERREEILDAAIVEFARGGLEGTSTEDIARRAGISQPYVFRLFGTKKELFLETVRRCFRETIETFRAAAAGAERGEELLAMGRSYLGLLEDRNRLRVQLHAYTAADDPDVRDVVRRGFGEIFTLAEEVSGAPAEEVTRWLAHGMLLNVMAAMDLERSEAAWAQRLIDECRKD